MAYRRKAKTYRLVWEEGDYAGLEVKAKSMPLGKFLEAAPKFAAIQEKGAISTAEMVEMVEPLKMLAGAIVSWNIEDEDDDGNVTSLPCDFDGLMSLDPDMIFEILRAWTEARATTAPPLETLSLDGDLEASLPMEELTPSLGS